MPLPSYMYTPAQNALVLRGTSAGPAPSPIPPARTGGITNLQAGAAGLTFGGAIGSGIGQFMQGRLQADLFGFNAKVARIQQADALERGREAESRYREGVRQLIGSQRARLAAQGLDPNEGTALDIQADTARTGELDALQIRNNAAMEAWGFKVQEISSKFQAKVAKHDALVSATGTILQGAAGGAGYFA